MPLEFMVHLMKRERERERESERERRSVSGLCVSASSGLLGLVCSEHDAVRVPPKRSSVAVVHAHA